MQGADSRAAGRDPECSFPVDANGEAQPWQIEASGIPTYSATYNRRVAPDPLAMNANGNNFD